jgi:hypothetical protein
MDLFKTKKSPARGWLLVLGALTLVGGAALLLSCDVTKADSPLNVIPAGPQQGLIPALTTPEDVDEALTGAIKLVIAKDYGRTWEDLLKQIQAACEDVPGKTVALDLSETSLAVKKNGVFDPRNPADNKPYYTGERYITRLTLPNAATEIAGGKSSQSGNTQAAPFAGFTGLEKVYANQVKTIEDNAFGNSPQLKEASFPAVELIGQEAFGECPALIGLYLPERPPVLSFTPYSSLFKLSAPSDDVLTIYVDGGAGAAVAEYVKEWGVGSANVDASSPAYVYSTAGYHKTVNIVSFVK